MPTIAITAAFFVFLLAFISVFIVTVIQILKNEPAVPLAAGTFVLAFLLFGCTVVGEFGGAIGAKHDDDVARNQLEDITADEPEVQEPEEQGPEAIPLSNPSAEESDPSNDEEEPIDIKIVLDGKEINPVDVLGNPADPFVIDGTTYLPVRAVASALGLDVEWDAENSTVILTSQKDEPPKAGSSAPSNPETPSSPPASTSDSSSRNTSNSSSSNNSSQTSKNSSSSQTSSSSSGTSSSNQSSSNSQGNSNNSSGNQSGITLAPTDPSNKSQTSGNSQTQSNSTNRPSASSSTTSNNSGASLSLADPITNTGNSSVNNGSQTSSNSNPSSASNSSGNTTSGNTNARAETIVYVSNRSNTIHSIPNCSNMKNYREMTMAEADANNYDYCKNCW